MNDAAVSPARPLEPEPKAIIVGASSGIGAALAAELARRGYCVAVLARREPELKAVCASINAASGQTRVLPYVHDVTELDAIPALFQEITRALEGLDLIVYVAGKQTPVAPDEYDTEKDRAMMAVNVLGAMGWLNLAAARFSQAGAGHIVGISSITGDRGRRAFPAYHTSKGALSIYLESLRNRLWPHGVVVTTIKPGFVETRLLENVDKPLWPISADEAARQITNAIRKKKQTVYVPGRWLFVSLVIRHIPSVIFRRMSF